VEEMEALKLTSQESPVFTTTDWGDKRINIMGRWIEDVDAARLRTRISGIILVT
jgi:hypothetical protein